MTVLNKNVAQSTVLGYAVNLTLNDLQLLEARNIKVNLGLYEVDEMYRYDVQLVLYKVRQENRIDTPPVLSVFDIMSNILGGVTIESIKAEKGRVDARITYLENRTGLKIYTIIRSHQVTQSTLNRYNGDREAYRREVAELVELYRISDVLTSELNVRGF